MKMKLGWWRDRSGKERKITQQNPADSLPWVDSEEWSYAPNGTFWGNEMQHSRDLIEFLRPLEDLPPALNSAVKAAEDRVRELKQMVDETQTAWATACRLHEAAKKELERLEKEITP